MADEGTQPTDSQIIRSFEICYTQSESCVTDNLWHQLWGSVEPVPAAEQPAVIDALKYGEAVMDWFEELSGPELVEQLFHTATSASCQQLIQKTQARSDAVRMDVELAEQVAPLAVLQEGINALSAAAVVEDWMSACCDRCKTRAAVSAAAAFNAAAGAVIRLSLLLPPSMRPLVLCFWCCAWCCVTRAASLPQCHLLQWSD